MIKHCKKNLFLNKLKLNRYLLSIIFFYLFTVYYFVIFFNYSQAFSQETSLTSNLFSQLHSQLDEKDLTASSPMLIEIEEISEISENFHNISIDHQVFDNQFHRYLFSELSSYYPHAGFIVLLPILFKLFDKNYLLAASSFMIFFGSSYLFYWFYVNNASLDLVSSTKDDVLSDSLFSDKSSLSKDVIIEPFSNNHHPPPLFVVLDNNSDDIHLSLKKSSPSI